MATGDRRGVLVLIGAAMLALSVSASAEDVEARAPKADAARAKPEFHAGMDGASEAARSSGGLVLVVFGSRGCGHCEAFARDVLDAEGFKRAGALHVVRVDAGVAPDRAREFGVGGVPDLVLMTGIGKIVSRRRGAMSLAEFLAWLERATAIEAAGLWLGTAPEQSPSEMAEGGPKPRTVSIDKLVRRLGSPVPGDRARARKELASRGRSAVPALVAASKDEYLGARVGAGEALRRLLADGAPLPDPWAPGEERTKATEALQKWWRESGKLRPAGAPSAEGAAGDREGQATGDAIGRAARKAVGNVLSKSPPVRTSGMTALVGIGTTALPALREGLSRASRGQDDAALAALQETRWAILVPRGVEKRFPGIRMSLARGMAPERRRRTKELRSAGAPAIPALAELVKDPDNLVREAALHALSGVSGPGALEAMAGLLEAEDANLRMTAAQSLGRTKNAAAAGHIAEALDDEDEVVVCAAVAALEEVKAKNQKDALVRRLKDTRWRVRAAAAEAIGNLEIKDAKDALRKLLKDPDDFVVKKSLEALKEMDVSLDYDELKPVMKRLPGIASVALGILIAKDSKSALATAEKVYDDSGPVGRVAVLERLAEIRNYSNSKDDYWEKLLAKAVASENSDVRAGCARAIERRSPALASKFVAMLLDDEEADVREATVPSVLRVAAADLGAGRRGRGAPSPVTGMVSKIVDAVKKAAEGDKGGVLGASSKQEEMRGKHALWHGLLLAHAPDTPCLALALAIYVTGDGKSDLPEFEASLALKDLNKAFDGAVREAGFPLAMKRLPWPEGERFLNKACAIPFMHARLLELANAMSKEARAFVLDPGRLERSLLAAEKRDLRSLLQSLLQKPGESAASLRSETDASRELLGRMAASSRPALRAAATFARGFWKDAASLAAIEEATKESDARARATAVGALARRLKTQEDREGKLARFLTDPAPAVVQAAAVSLLLTEVRSDAGLERYADYFRYGSEVAVYLSYSRMNSERPLVALRREPDFLKPLRERLPALAKAEAKAKDDERVDVLAPVALLLAQYGDPSGLDVLAARWSKAKDADVPDAVIAAIALTRSAKHLGILRRAAAAADSSWEVRELIKALRGMRGREARAMRRELNKRLRDLGTM